MPEKEEKKTFSFVWKIIIAVGVIVSLFISLYTVDARFAKSDQLKILQVNIEKDTCNALKLAEAESVKTFQGLQMQQIMMNKSLQLQILNIQKESIEKDYWDIKRRLRSNPNDIELQNDFNEVKKQREIIKEKIEQKILEK